MNEDLAKLHHSRSKKDFPDLGLEDDEYVELAISRSKYGLLFIWSLAIIASLILGFFALSVSFGGEQAMANIGMNPSAISYLYLIILVLIIAISLCAVVATSVYSANKMYVTNRRIFHYEAFSLFSKSVNVIGLWRIEDVSFRQSNLLDHILHLGTIRLSTVGDETTYTFKYVDTPTDELQTIMHLVQVRRRIHDKEEKQATNGE